MTGKEVKEWRESMGLTQSQLAEMCGLKTRAVQKWEAAEVVSSSTESRLKALQKDVKSTSCAKTDSGTAVAGFGNHVNADKALLRAFDEIAAQRRLTEKAQAQVDELLALVKVLTSK